MGKYSMPMNDEKKPRIKQLIPEGWHKFKIVGVEERTSKAGNMMFVITARHIDSGYDDTWFAVAEAGKRWFLKSILAACGCKASADGVYDWDPSDITGKNVLGLSVHEDNDYINRDGETVKSKQHKIADIMETEQDPVEEEEKAWDE